MEKVITKLKLDRNSNLELLRIILMIMIIFHHFAVHGGFYYEYQEFFLIIYGIIFWNVVERLQRILMF